MMKPWLIGIVGLIMAGCSAATGEMPLNPQQDDISTEAESRLAVDQNAGNAPTATPEQIVRAPLEDYGPAPELSNEVWLNADTPLRLADLRGRVVLLDMWTFGCINCQHVIPSLRAWHESYQSQGLVVIGNHYPEFSYEADLDNLKEAIQRLDVPYAVAQDNQGETWRAYHNRYWPTLYLIDKQGHIRYRHIGEGAYAETEEAIQALLAETYP